jgi:hypothetical protein
MDRGKCRKEMENCGTDRNSGDTPLDRFSIVLVLLHEHLLAAGRRLNSQAGTPALHGEFLQKVCQI